MRSVRQTKQPTRHQGFIPSKWRRTGWALARSYEFSERLIITTFIGSDLEQRKKPYERVRADEGRYDTPRWQRIVQQSSVDTISQLVWLASIVEGGNDAILGKNLDGVITTWNKGAERLYGYSAEQIIGQTVTILIPPERRHEEHAIRDSIRRGAPIEHFETVRQRKDGSLVDVSLTISPMRGEAGKIVGASTIARDISERKRSEAQISVLAREAEHRAKNLLANVRAIVDLSQSETPKGLKEAIKGRIDALANVHSLFVQSRWTGADLASLVKSELSPIPKGGEMRTQINGPIVILKPEMAQAIALALHELATNAAKYGALSVARGQVRVDWSRATNGELVLRWSEAGGPPVNPPARKGFGTHMMDAMIQGLWGGCDFAGTPGDLRAKSLFQRDRAPHALARTFNQFFFQSVAISDL